MHLSGALILAYVTTLSAAIPVRRADHHVLRQPPSAPLPALRLGEDCKQPSPCDSSPVHDVACRGEIVKGKSDQPVCTCRCSQVVFVSNAGASVVARLLLSRLPPLPLAAAALPLLPRCPMQLSWCVGVSAFCASARNAPPAGRISLSTTADNAQKRGSPLITWSELKDGKLQELAKTAGEWKDAILYNEENGIAKQWDLFVKKLLDGFTPNIFKKK